MYATHVRGIATLALASLSSSIIACGGSDKSTFGGQSSSAGSQNVLVNSAGFAGELGAGGFAPGGAAGAAGTGLTGAGGIVVNAGGVANGGVPGTGGMPALGTGGVVVDPGPRPTGQILNCRGTGPCLLDDNDACCIGASTDSQGNVVSVSENCIPPTASCTYPLSIAHCDGPEDCRQTEVCCGILKPYGNVPLFGELSCQPASECPGNQKFVVCRAGITVCPTGTTCGSFPTLPPDITICR